MILKTIKERRTLNYNVSNKNLNPRAEADNNAKKLIAYASVFNSPSKLIAELIDGELRTFYEVILPNAFDRVLADPALNVIATVNHDRNQMLGRNSSGTLTLSVDENGLLYSINMPDTTLGRDTYELVKRGDFSESSFVFTVDDQDQEWVEKPDGLYRYIRSVSGLYDCSIVVDGAYYTGDISARDTVKFARDIKDLIKREVATVEAPAAVKVEQTTVVEQKPAVETKPEPVLTDTVDIEVFLLQNSI